MTHPLIVHHLGRSQSERIVWLCEELGLPYELVRYDRRADNRLGPPEYKALYPMGTAPVITDGDVVLGESAAIVDYVIATRGDGRLAVARDQPNFADYLYWFHFANGTLQPVVMQAFLLERVDPAATQALLPRVRTRFDLVLSLVDRRLADHPYLAGGELTAADIMAVFTFTTMRLFHPYDLAPWPNIRAYLQRIGARPAYQRAMQRADPDLTPLLGVAECPSKNRSGERRARGHGRAMTFRIQGLPTDTFAPLFDLDDAALAARGAVRRVADGRPVFPCRISLTDAAAGDEVILTHYEHHAVDTPFRASHAIYVRRGEQQYDAVDQIPAQLRTRLLSVRAFDRTGMLVNADVVDGQALEATITALFADPRADYLHVHFAKPGCYAARVLRA